MMNVDMTNVNALVAERDAFMEDYNKKASVHEEQYNNYIIAYEAWRNSIAEKVRNIIKGNRVDFQALNHYKKIALTGNPAVDSLYYED